MRLLDLARSNNLFGVLTRSLDDENSKFHLLANHFALPYIGEPNVPQVLKDALTHCKGRIVEGKDQMYLRRVEENLRQAKADFRKVRQIYAMKSIKKRNWSMLQVDCDRFDT